MPPSRYPSAFARAQNLGDAGHYGPESHACIKRPTWSFANGSVRPHAGIDERQVSGRPSAAGPDASLGVSRLAGSGAGSSLLPAFKSPSVAVMDRHDARNAVRATTYALKG